LIPGDGISPEIVEATLDILEALGAPFVWDRQLGGMVAVKTWRRLKGENQLPKVIAGVTFRNGVEIINTPEQSAA